MPDSVRYKHNRLQQLRGFCYAAQEGSVSKAAEKMFLSQPSVSLQIQAHKDSGSALTYSATGLPPGLSIDTATGLISGTLTAAASAGGTVTLKVNGIALGSCTAVTSAPSGTAG